MGGVPSRGTPADKRLRRNKPRKQGNVPMAPKNSLTALKKQTQKKK